MSFSINRDLETKRVLGFKRVHCDTYIFWKTRCRPMCVSTLWRLVFSTFFDILWYSLLLHQRNCIFFLCLWRQAVSHVNLSLWLLRESLWMLPSHVTFDGVLLTCYIPGFCIHMLFALSDTLWTELASVYSHMFKYNAVPDVLQIGIIVPILKKSTLPSNDYNNFRPINLSTVHAKLVELIILPMVNLDIGGNQYGYQTGKGTEFCCALLNDSVAYFNEDGSAVYMCTLDAVKCFDNMWHEGLFYKLMSRMSIIYWRLLFNWYKSMRATIRLNNEFSQFLNITKGTRQGSVLSPHLFNVFIDDLMRDLEGCPYGLRIGSLKINTAGYADDITLIASTQPDLQKLADICYRYSCKWRFSFGASKSKCIIMRKRSISLSQPDIWLGTSKLQFVDRVEILGRVFSHNLPTQDHISSRMQSSRRAMFGMGINNEGISPSVKAYLWKSVGVPSLVYALGTCNINQSDLKRLESFQGTVIKNSMYLGKRCHHSALLKALEVPSIESLIEKQRIGLLKCAFRVKSPYTDLVIELISKYSDGHSHQRYSRWSVSRKRSCSTDDCFWFCL